MCAESIAFTREVEIRNPSHIRAMSVGVELRVCAGVRFVQVRLTGTHVRGFGAGLQCPLRMTGVSTCAACGMCWCVRVCDVCKVV